MFSNTLIPIKVIYLVDGYIHEIENDAKNKKISMPSIPKDIYKFIYLFYNYSTFISTITPPKTLIETPDTTNCDKWTSSIGIDFGSTYSCIATTNNKAATQIISNNFGERTMPSYVNYANDNILTGVSAKNIQWNKNSVFHIKKLIGNKKSTDPVIQSSLKHWPFTIIKATDYNQYPLIQVEYKEKTQTFLPHEIASEILKQLKSISESHFGNKIEDAVLAVPAHFNDKQRSLMKEAAKMAGLNCLRIINEPVAACIAYDLHRMTPEDEESKALVFHLGGGTLSVSVLNIEDDVYEILAEVTDINLGGNIFDDILAQHFVKDFCHKNESITQNEIINNKKVMSRLRIKCEKMKHLLSTLNKATLEIDSFYNNIDLVSEITRARFENLCNEYFKQCINYVPVVLQNAGLTKSDINSVVLSGGSMRIPKLQQMINEYFNDETLIYNSINPEEVIAFGVSIQAAILSGYYNPSEIVIFDVNPLSLGIKTLNGVMTTLIPRNSVFTYGYIITETFTTWISNETDNKVSIQIYRGENTFVKHNELLNEIDLIDIKCTNNTMPQIDITFCLDLNHFLEVTVMDKSNSNNTCKISIDTNRYGRFSEEEIQKIVEEAERNENKEEKNRQRIQSKNELLNILEEMKEIMNDKEQIKNVVTDTINWIGINSNATKQEYITKTKELTAIFRFFSFDNEKKQYLSPLIEEID